MQASVKVSAWMLRPRRVSQIPQRGAQALALCSPRKQIKICACRRLTAEKTAQQPAESGCRPGGGGAGGVGLQAAQVRASRMLVVYKYDLYTDTKYWGSSPRSKG